MPGTVLSAFSRMDSLTPDAASWDGYTYYSHVLDVETEHTSVHM